MKIYITIGLLILFFPVHLLAPIGFLSPSPIRAQEISIEKPISIPQLINEYAEKYGVSSTTLYKVITCETAGTFDPLIQSYVIKNGTREDSWGLAQWFLPAQNKKHDGTVITKEDAQNPDIALDTMAWYFATHRANKWSCYNKIYGSK